MFERILIANRGEIALRILRACRRMGIAAVVAYSEADRDTRAVQLADEAICVGPAEAKRSYLSAPAILSAAIVTGCDAIHPGYGFLSEDDTFAEMTRAHGLTFIGPPPEVLERFASKAGTRHLLASHGLPTIPGSAEMLRDDDHALAEAERIGYPVLIKPSAGGGGRGMRMVRSPRELQQAITICRSEARAAFGDDSLYLEKWLEENRHVEVQVIVDRYGNGVHVGERDCSVQRRHQKIVEESPAPALTRGQRRALPDRRRGRRGGRLRERGHARVPGRPVRPGLLHRDQLPHPGRAPGHRDALGPRPRGRADPHRRRRAAGLQPGGRRAARPRHRVPHQRRGRGPRLPAAGRRGGALPRPGRPGRAHGQPPLHGYEVPPFYDSLLGKLIVWGPDRATAIARARGALDELVVDGLVTNVAFHRALLRNETFVDGEFTTNLLDRVGSAAFVASGARPQADG